MTIRRFRPSDEEQCLELRRECWASQLSKCYPSDISRRWTRRYKKGYLLAHSKTHDMWVLERKGEILGFISLQAKKSRARIYFFFVKRSEQRKGVGRKLYSRSEKELLKAHPETKLLVVDSVWYVPSIKFYESLGYEKVRTVIHNKNPTDRTLWMEKQVNKRVKG